MKVEIKVPPAGESVTEATVAAIMVENGTFVNKDDEILELETDKVNQVLYAPDSGTLNLTVSVDTIVKPNQVIGFIDTEGKGQAKAAAAPSAPQPKKEEAPPLSPSAGEGIRRSVDDYVASIGKEKAAPPPSEAKLPPPKKIAQQGQARKRMSGLRRTVAKRLVEAKNTTAMLTTFNEVDMSAVMEIRAREKDAFMQRHQAKLGFMSFFVK
ncbi:MAG: 2-oxo acid dehydrogenase subunit E2, partial [Simkania sp.]|nr:2-oxo acid dehydrogenase subunit E2 [Simkania sp.]